MKPAAAGSLYVAAALALAGLGALAWRSVRPGASDADLALHHPDEYAWVLFARVNRPIPGSSETWLTWKDARQIYPSFGSKVSGQSRFSPFLDSAEAAPLDAQFGDCGGAPRVTISMDGNAANYITGNGLNEIAGIKKYAVDENQPISFPPGSVAMKLGWLPSPRFPDRQFMSPQEAPDPTSGKMVPWGLGGFHIMSKAVPQWFFATFESTCVQSAGSDFADPALRDDFGYPDGENMSAGLRNLFRENHLDPVWAQYRLVGAQTGFTSASETPLELGNQVIEAGHTTPSCMVCHALARAGRDGLVVDYPPPPPEDTPLQRPDPKIFQDKIPLDSIWSLMHAGEERSPKKLAPSPRH